MKKEGKLNVSLSVGLHAPEQMWNLNIMLSLKGCRGGWSSHRAGFVGLAREDQVFVLWEVTERAVRGAYVKRKCSIRLASCKEPCSCHMDFWGHAWKGQRRKPLLNPDEPESGFGEDFLPWS